MVASRLPHDVSPVCSPACLTPRHMVAAAARRVFRSAGGGRIRAGPQSAAQSPADTAHITLQSRGDTEQ